MVPSQSQRSTEQYARRGSKERRSSEAAKERAPGREGAGWPLERSTSLEKEIGAGEVETPKKKSRSPRIRRPHTSDSVASAASGSTGPPRFGHSTTHSSGCLVGVAEGAQEPLHVFRTEQGRRGHHHVTRSTSAQAAPRSESLDGGTRAIIPRGSADSEDGDDGALPHSGRAASTRSPLGQSSSQAQSQSQSPSMPPAGSLFMASSATIDELGTGGRPLKQRFGGGFRSLFGKSR
ncbi:hypothetical protein JB92DRAFT_2921224 [Gautieria morchelliformis]|nr:hypothetical protein JB92DRAFT_2921224 [Gautieria morchelliformis]